MKQADRHKVNEQTDARPIQRSKVSRQNTAIVQPCSIFPSLIHQADSLQQSKHTTDDAQSRSGPHTPARRAQHHPGRSARRRRGVSRARARTGAGAGGGTGAGARGGRAATGGGRGRGGESRAGSFDFEGGRRGVDLFLCNVVSVSDIPRRGQRKAR